MSSLVFDIAGGKPPTLEQIDAERRRLSQAEMRSHLAATIIGPTALFSMMHFGNSIPGGLLALMLLGLIVGIFKFLIFTGQLRSKASCLNQVNESPGDQWILYDEEKKLVWTRYHEAVKTQGRPLVMAELWPSTCPHLYR